jgi:hypothetical protein
MSSGELVLAANRIAYGKKEGQHGSGGSELARKSS